MLQNSSERIQRLKLKLRRTSLPAILTVSPINIRYLTGLELSFGVLLVPASGKPEIFVDGRYREVSGELDFIITRSLNELSGKMSSLRKVGFEPEYVSFARLSRWAKKYKNIKFVQSFDLIEGLRRQKDNYEISQIRRACSITKEVLLQIPRYLKGRITERQLSWKIAEMSHNLGGDSLAFDTIVGFGEHTARPHHHPTDRRLRSGDIVQIDMGVKVNGYCSDFSRVYFIGEPTPEQARAYRALMKAKKEAENSIEPGILNRNLDTNARETLQSFDLDTVFPHALGHGVGLEIHEGVSLSRRAPKMKLLKNEVITIEPGVYFKGKWGMRVEDTILVTENGARKL